jgi:hypothetical protein
MNCFIFEQCKNTDKDTIIISFKGWDFTAGETQDVFNWLIAFLHLHKPELLTQICRAHWEKQKESMATNLQLWKGIREKDVTQVQDALDKGANPIFHRALDLAAQVGNVKIIQILIKAGASIVMQNGARHIAVYWARNKTKVIQELIGDLYPTLSKLKGHNSRSVLTVCRQRTRKKLRLIHPEYPSDSESDSEKLSHSSSHSDSDDSPDSDSNQTYDAERPTTHSNPAHKKIRLDFPAAASGDQSGPGGPSSTDQPSSAGGPSYPRSASSYTEDLALLASLLGEIAPADLENLEDLFPPH